MERNQMQRKYALDGEPHTILFGGDCWSQWKGGSKNNNKNRNRPKSKPVHIR